MGYRIAVLDDERAQAEALRALVLAWGKDAGADCAVEIFASAEAFLFAREGGGVFDILLLDVEMSGMSGLELARRLRADGDHAQLAFITSHFEFVAEGY
ncbi:MAG: response regulator, partial [Eubacteriales bacterium]|nr:response regulator [Eubacteriales bacterium]